KKSKNGNFIGCNGYPECKRAYPLPKGALIQMLETTCPECSLAQIKVVRKGMPPSTQCIDPKCKSNTEKNDLGACPTCKTGTIRITYSKAGKRFAGCSEWPNCSQTYPLRPRGTIAPTGVPCPECGAPTISIGSMTECINMDCPTRKKRKAVGTETAEGEAPAEEKKKTTTRKTAAKKKTTATKKTTKKSAASTE
ncbi:MAG: topoisomerase DNA-binding C4 zinc finger domain-containing protein, partial [archaeon]|nr:topoisomerase DNA-binding C4 zinc finger domain-containing protein [archaeon]